MPTRATSPTRERLVDAAVAVIDRNGGAAGVTLRDIAEEAGCSPPNVYNWFSGLEELLTAALVRICRDFLERIRSVVPEEPADEVLVALVRTYVEFAVDHPGRLNVYHFERLGGGLRPEAVAAGVEVGRAMGAILARAGGPLVPDETAAEISAVLHSFLIGRLSEHITGRVPITDRDAAVADVVAEALRLHAALVGLGAV